MPAYLFITFDKRTVFVPAKSLAGARSLLDVYGESSKTSTLQAIISDTQNVCTVDVIEQPQSINLNKPSVPC